ncbi:hypothetical protein BZA77DRAFT_355298 [Pyronema omphalodes]|nr:hypothetical protein BZA77DRAFT_355298 [Pyronema omphalodes]
MNIRGTLVLAATWVATTLAAPTPCWPPCVHHDNDASGLDGSVSESLWDYILSGIHTWPPGIDHICISPLEEAANPHIFPNENIIPAGYPEDLEWIDFFNSLNEHGYNHNDVHSIPVSETPISPPFVPHDPYTRSSSLLTPDNLLPPQHEDLERPPYSGPPVAPDYDSASDSGSDFDSIDGIPEISISAPPPPPFSSTEQDSYPSSRIHKRQADNFGLSGWNAGYAVEFPTWSEAFGGLTSAVGGAYDSARSWWKGDDTVVGNGDSEPVIIDVDPIITTPEPEMMPMTEQVNESNGLWASFKNLFGSSATVSALDPQEPVVVSQAPATGVWDNVKSWWRGDSTQASTEVLDGEKVKDEMENKGNGWSWLSGAQGLWRTDFEGVDNTGVPVPEVPVPVIEEQVLGIAEGSINEATDEISQIPEIPEIPEMPEVAIPETPAPEPDLPPLPEVTALPSTSPPSKSALKPWVQNSYQLSSAAGPSNDKEISDATTEAVHNRIANAMAGHLAEPKNVRFGYLTSVEGDPMTFGQWSYDEDGNSDAYNRNEENARGCFDCLIGGEDPDADDQDSDYSDDESDQSPPWWSVGPEVDPVWGEDDNEPPEVFWVWGEDGMPQWIGDPEILKLVESPMPLEDVMAIIQSMKEKEKEQEEDSDSDWGDVPPAGHYWETWSNDDFLSYGKRDEAGLWHPALNDVSMEALPNVVDEDTLAVLNNIEEPLPVMDDDNDIYFSISTESVGGEESLPVLVDNTDFTVPAPAVPNDLAEQSLHTAVENGFDASVLPGIFFEDAPMDVVEDTELGELYKPVSNEISTESLPTAVEDNSLPADAPPPILEIDDEYFSNGDKIHMIPDITDKPLPDGFIRLSSESPQSTAAPSIVKYRWKPTDTLPDNDAPFDRNTIYSFESSGSERSRDSLGLPHDAWMNYVPESPVPSSESSIYSFDPMHSRPHASDDELPDSPYESDSFSTCDAEETWSDDEIWSPPKPAPRDDELADDYDPYDENGKLKEPWGIRSYGPIDSQTLAAPMEDDLGDDYDPYDETGKLVRPWRDVDGPLVPVRIVHDQGGHGHLLASAENFVWPEDDDSHTVQVHHVKPRPGDGKHKPSPGRYDSMDLTINPPTLQDIRLAQEQARRQAAAQGRPYKPKHKHNHVSHNNGLGDASAGYSDDKWNVPVFGDEEGGLLTNSELDRFNRIDKPREQVEERIWKRQTSWGSDDTMDGFSEDGDLEASQDFPEFPDEYPPYLRPGAPGTCAACDVLDSLTKDNWSTPGGSHDENIDSDDGISIYSSTE